MMRKTNLFAVLTAVVALTFTACTNIEDVAMPGAESAGLFCFCQQEHTCS